MSEIKMQPLHIRGLKTKGPKTVEQLRAEFEQHYESRVQTVGSSIESNYVPGSSSLFAPALKRSFTEFVEIDQIMKFSSRILASIGHNGSLVPEFNIWDRGSSSSLVFAPINMGMYAFDNSPSPLRLQETPPPSLDLVLLAAFGDQEPKGSVRPVDYFTGRSYFSVAAGYERGLGSDGRDAILLSLRAPDIFRAGMLSVAAGVDLAVGSPTHTTQLSLFDVPSTKDGKKVSQRTHDKSEYLRFDAAGECSVSLFNVDERHVLDAVGTVRLGDERIDGDHLVSFGVGGGLRYSMAFYALRPIGIFIEAGVDKNFGANAMTSSYSKLDVEDGTVETWKSQPDHSLPTGYIKMGFEAKEMKTVRAWVPND